MFPTEWPVAATSAGLTHFFVCLVCFVHYLYVGPFGLRRGQSTASCLGFIPGLDLGKEGTAFKLLLPTSQDIFFSTLPFSSVLSLLSHTRHMIPVQTMRSRRSGKEFFLLTSSPGFLAFSSIRTRGFVFFLLIPVWKHFTLSSIEWVNCKMGKGSSKELTQAKNKNEMCADIVVVSPFSSKREGKVIPVSPSFYLKQCLFIHH